jgi:hypothetical protein
VSPLSQEQTPRDEVPTDRILLLSYSGQTVLQFIPKSGQTRTWEFEVYQIYTVL